MAAGPAVGPPASEVRIGLRTAPSLKMGDNYTGKGVHEAARISALAGAGEVVASLHTVNGAGGSVAISPPRAVELKGIAEPLDVVTIEWG